MSERIYGLRKASLTSVEADGELVALDLRSSVYFGVNASGHILWERLTSGATAAELAAALCDRYGIDQDAAARDVGTFLQEMEQAGVLTSASTPASQLYGRRANATFEVF